MHKYELVKRIKEEFPDLEWKTAEHNVEGFDHYVLMLDDKYVFRFPRATNYRRRLHNEVLMLKYLSSKVKLPIPNHEFISKDKSFAGYRFLQGEKLTKEKFSKIPEKDRTVIAEQFAEFLTQLHSTPQNIAKKFAIPNDANTKTANRRLFETVKKFLPHKISKTHYQMILDYFSEYNVYQNFPKKCLIHYDLFHNHILYNSKTKRLSGIVDFSDRGYDDPALDFAELWVYGENFVEQIYSKYAGPQDKEFLKRSHIYYKRVAIFGLTSPFRGGNGSFALGKRLFRQIF